MTYNGPEPAIVRMNRERRLHEEKRREAIQNLDRKKFLEAVLNKLLEEIFDHGYAFDDGAADELAMHICRGLRERREQEVPRYCSPRPSTEVYEEDDGLPEF